MIKFAVLSIAFLYSLASGFVFGQTAAQIKEQYGLPTEAFSASENIWMTPEYTADGQLCKMRLYPKKISADTNYLSSTLNYWELKDVLNKIALPETRGKRKELFNLTIFLGQFSNTLYSFENLTFSFLTPFHGRMEITPATKPASETAKTEEVVKSEEMTVPHYAEIATIKWTGRTCANK